MIKDNKYILFGILIFSFIFSKEENELLQCPEPHSLKYFIPYIACKDIEHYLKDINDQIEISKNIPFEGTFKDLIKIRQARGHEIAQLIKHIKQDEKEIFLEYLTKSNANLYTINFFNC